MIPVQSFFEQQNQDENKFRRLVAKVSISIYCTQLDLQYIEWLIFGFEKYEIREEFRVIPINLLFKSLIPISAIEI